MTNNMNNDLELIRSYFKKLGLETEIADIYTALRSYGPQSMSELSRSSGVERTRLYRLIDELLASNLIELENRESRALLRAAPISNLRILLSEREQEVKSLHDELELIETILRPNQLESPTTRIQTYQGPAGIRQMLWNETKATDTIRSILFENIQVRTDSRFFERWAEACNANKISLRGLVGQRFLDSQDTWYKGAVKERLNDWTYKLADETVYPIEYTTIVYNNVTAYFSWHNKEVFGCEIYNQAVADSHKRIFDMLWTTACN